MNGVDEPEDRLLSFSTVLSRMCRKTVLGKKTGCDKLTYAYIPVGEKRGLCTIQFHEGTYRVIYSYVKKEVIEEIWTEFMRVYDESQKASQARGGPILPRNIGNGVNFLIGLGWHLIETLNLADGAVAAEEKNGRAELIVSAGKNLFCKGFVEKSGELGFDVEDKTQGPAVLQLLVGFIKDWNRRQPVTGRVPSQNN